MEPKINDLAHSYKELFPIIDLVSKLATVVGLITKDLTSMHVSIHENNVGVLVLTETIQPQLTPRRKWYALTTVWFREETHKRCIKLLKIDTVGQLGYMFTKGLTRTTLSLFALEGATSVVRVLSSAPILLESS